MTALNDVLVLRFVQQNPGRHDISFLKAANVAFALNDFTDALLEPFLRAQPPTNLGKITQLVLVAEPRLGSLELIFQLEIALAIDVNPGLLTQIGDALGEVVSVTADLTTIATFILMLGFSPNGVFARKTAQARRTHEPSPMDGIVDHLAASVSERVVDQIDGLVRAAAATQCVRVEVEVRGLGEVQLAPSDYRRSGAIIGRRLQQRNRPEFSLVRLEAVSPLPMKTRAGNSIMLFLARTTDGDPVALAWNRNDSPPDDRSFEVQGVWIEDPLTLNPEEEVSEAFEHVRGIYLVDKWRESWR